MTPKQLALFQFIERFIAAHGYSPSFDEIAAALGLASKSGVYQLVRALTQRGFIRQRHGRSRSIEILRRPGGLAGPENEAHERGMQAAILEAACWMNYDSATYPGHEHVVITILRTYLAENPQGPPPGAAA